jgi:hypothetical protein
MAQNAHSSQYGGHMHAGESAQGVADQADGVVDTAAQTGRALGEFAGDLATDVATAIKERPYTSIAVAAGLAFAVGALWKLRNGRQPSRLEALLARLPDTASLKSNMPARWR